jgi:hypothetical protein
MSFTKRPPIAPNAADEGTLNPRCQRRNVHTRPTDCSLGTHPCRKTRSIERHSNVT